MCLKFYGERPKPTSNTAGFSLPHVLLLPVENLGGFRLKFEDQHYKLSKAKHR
jgi:hypothetical protein